MWHLYCFLQQLKTTNVFNQSFSNEIPWSSNIWWMSQEGGKCDFIWFNRVFLSISYPALFFETIRRIKWLKSLIFRIIKDFWLKWNEICKIFLKVYCYFSDHYILDSFGLSFIVNISCEIHWMVKNIYFLIPSIV